MQWFGKQTSKTFKKIFRPCSICFSQKKNHKRSKTRPETKYIYICIPKLKEYGFDELFLCFKKKIFIHPFFQRRRRPQRDLLHLLRVRRQRGVGERQLRIGVLKRNTNCSLFCLFVYRGAIARNHTFFTTCWFWRACSAFNPRRPRGSIERNTDSNQIAVNVHRYLPFEYMYWAKMTKF